MKDFFDRQENARRKTTHLFFLFVFAVVIIVFCIYIATSVIYFFSFEYKFASIPDPDFWNLTRIIVISTIALCVILSGSFYKIHELKDGGYRVAELLGGRRVFPVTGDSDERRLLNVVEEMAIASGIPVPAVYVMEREGGINAFASGYGIDDAVISVTKGSIALLSREELQGVIAHEFSHIFNGDTSINIRLLGWLHGILLISLIGEGVLRKTGRVRMKGSMPLAVLGCALYGIGYIGVFFGKLIKSAVSRQREYLADASAVQFTRNPSGLAGALKKIGGLARGSLLLHHRVSEASHMYFSNGVGKNWFSVMATHPPILSRILLLDPDFNGVFPKIQAVNIAPIIPAPKIKPAARPAKHIKKIFTGAAAMAILSTIGAPMKEHARLARELLDQLPEPLTIATRDPFSACSLVYLLLLDKKKDIREKQRQVLETADSGGILEEIEKLAEYSTSLTARNRLLLIDLAIPALRSLSRAQFKTFKDNVNSLIDADQQISLFEYVLRLVLFKHLDASFIQQESKVVQIYSARGVIRECSCVLSLLARSGHEDDAKASSGFTHGKRILADPGFELDFLPPDECTPENFSKALLKLDTTSPLVKKKLLAACLECLTFDKIITADEAELFRAIAEALGCPVPPWLSLQDKEYGMSK